MSKLHVLRQMLAAVLCATAWVSVASAQPVADVAPVESMAPPVTQQMMPQGAPMAQYPYPGQQPYPYQQQAPFMGRPLQQNSSTSFPGMDWNSTEWFDKMPWNYEGPWGNTPPWGDWSDEHGGYPWGRDQPWGDKPVWRSNRPPQMWGYNSGQSMGGMPLTNPMSNDGFWSRPNYRPWSSGPFAREKWSNHPMKKMPWGSFPGWGDGFFGGYGPDTWKGITPWGNDVPFRWMDYTDPKDAVGNMWDDAINTPNVFGRMPPGWTAPYISVPNPIDVGEEFERNARKFPSEMRKMTGSED